MHAAHEGRVPVLLVLNAGSSSLKFSLYDAGQPPGETPHCLARGLVEPLADRRLLVFKGDLASTPPPAARSWRRALADLLAWIERSDLGPLAGAAHRVVHGGERTAVAARLDDRLLAQLRALVPWAPLHQPRCLAPIAWLARRYPGLAQVACFDTAFHHSLDALETRFGLPAALSEQGLRRYGFHGLSYEYIAGVLAGYDPRAAQGRTIVAHLGSGASLCALHNRISRATTMGFSTLDGLLMATRPGRLDPGILLYLLREQGMSVPALEDLLYHRCGWLGVSAGQSSDMRVLSASQTPQAREAVALFVRSVIKEIGALAAVLGGLDALVFTAGIGEHAHQVRQAILDGCRWLGVRSDPASAGQRCLSRADSAVTAWVIPTDENIVIARHALRHLHGAG